MFRQGIINYSKLYGDVIEFQITVPQEIDVSSVELSLPKLKYNKDMVVSWINDDSYSIWNNIFSLVNKKWVDNELMSYWDAGDDRVFFTHMNWSHNGVGRTNGYIPDKFLEYTDGAGIKHRYTSSVAAWVEKLGSTRDYQPGIFIPWDSAKEHRYMSDFGYTIVYHDLKVAPTTQESYDSQLESESQQFLTLTDRIPKIMAEPNGDHNYITFGKNNPIIQMQTAQNEVVSKAYPFSNNFTLNKNDITVERWFNISDTYVDDFINSVGTILALPEEQRQWLIGSVHRCAKATDSTIFQSIENLYGASGADNVWFTTLDEMYEWWFMRNNLVSTKSVSGQTISYKLYVPTNNNFWFKSLSVFLSNITDTTNISVSSSDNCKGTSYAINNGKLMINLDFNEDLEAKAEKYVSLCESSLDQFDLDDAQYFVNMLKPGIKESYQNRLNSVIIPINLISFVINNGDTTATETIVNIELTTSGRTPTEYILSENSDFIDATWMTYSSNPTFELSSGNGVKTIYAKIRDSYSESSVLSNSIILSVGETDTVVLFGNVTSGVVNGVGYVNTTLRANTSSSTIYTLNGTPFCTEQGQYDGYFHNELVTLMSYWGITKNVAAPQANWSLTLSGLLTGEGKYPNSIIANGVDRKINLYGGIEPVTTAQAPKYLTGVAPGNYTVKLLLSDISNTKSPSIVRVNNSTITVSDPAYFINNNQNWITFDNVVVESNGYMLISNYTDPALTAAYFRVAPIVLIEITKKS